MFRINRKPTTCAAVGFIYEFARKSKRGETYKRQYRCMAKHLSNFEKERNAEILSNMYNDTMCEDYLYYLRSRNLAQNTIVGYLQKTAFMFRKMAKRGFEVDFSFEEVLPDRDETVAVYLSDKELNDILALKLKKEVDVIRDLFLVGCYTGMRYSDYSQLTSRNIVNGNIVRKTQKTGEIVQIPIHATVRRILAKRNGEFPLYSNSTQNFNIRVKTICKRAKINDSVLVEFHKGNKVIRKTKKKYELVSSHTARRSFATNTYLAGIKVAQIMLITGHQTEKSFFKYIRITKSENAKMLSEHPFFSH
jgi:Site-specific recombinase XerD